MEQKAKKGVATVGLDAVRAWNYSWICSSFISRRDIRNVQFLCVSRKLELKGMVLIPVWSMKSSSGLMKKGSGVTFIRE